MARFNSRQLVFDRVRMEYIDHNAYEIVECPDSDYDMSECCVIQLVSYGK